jgi:F-type H+-transporting ATPase subunit b
VTDLMQTLILFSNTAEGEESGIAALGIDPLAILAQAVTFLVIFYVIKKFALEKIMNSLEERRKTIDKGVRLGYEMAEERSKLEKQIEDSLHKTRQQADKIIASAHEEAGEMIKAAEDTAARKVDTMLAEAHLKIGEDLNRAKKELEKEMLTLVADATEAIIDEKLDVRKDESLIQRALSGVRK